MTHTEILENNGVKVTSELLSFISQSPTMSSWINENITPNQISFILKRFEKESKPKFNIASAIAEMNDNKTFNHLTKSYK